MYTLIKINYNNVIKVLYMQVILDITRGGIIFLWNSQCRKETYRKEYVIHYIFCFHLYSSNFIEYGNKIVMRK